MSIVDFVVKLIGLEGTNRFVRYYVTENKVDCFPTYLSSGSIHGGKNLARCRCALPPSGYEPFADNERPRVAVLAPTMMPEEENCLPGVGGESVEGSGRRGGESSRVRTHSAMTNTAASPTLHNLLVPATGMLLPTIISTRSGILSFAAHARL